jgi:hypothetical protein
VSTRFCFVVCSLLLLAAPAAADSFFFSTGNPDGKIATLSRPGSPAGIETETADDFILTQGMAITSATFTGLIPLGVPLSSVSQVEIEFYHVFPQDSGPFDGNVNTRVNSPADVEIGSATRDSALGTLSFTPGIMNPNFTASNSVVTGINPKPNQFTGGEGPVTGQEVQFNVMFNGAVLLGPDHYFFRPEVLVTDGNFLWLSAPKPIVPPGTPFAPDLQTWIRNSDLDPDWSRVGTDITGQGPFNATFSLAGTPLPEPASWELLTAGLGVLAILRRLRR